MNTKEAIEFLEGQKNKPGDPVEPNRLGINLILDGIIELLQRGEKFEKMWRELDEKYGNRYRFDYIGSHSGKTTEFVKERMDDIKQKYFPKE